MHRNVLIYMHVDLIRQIICIVYHKFYCAVTCLYVVAVVNGIRCIMSCINSKIRKCVHEQLSCNCSRPHSVVD